MRGEKGFTVLEMVVALAVLSILTAVAVPVTSGYIRRAQDSALLLRAESARDATQSLLLELYLSPDFQAIPLIPLTDFLPSEQRDALFLSEVLELASLAPEDLPEVWVACDGEAALHFFAWGEQQRQGMRFAIWDGDTWQLMWDWDPDD